MSTWIRLCKADEIKHGEMRAFDLDRGSKRILLVNINGNLYSSDGICTHQYAELSEGFLNAEDKTITCPLHLSVFSFLDGKPQNPPAELPLNIYQTKVENDIIYVQI
jgi:3-phenylpropionate/trans-cinnamate dioxygenase ferredoxin component